MATTRIMPLHIGKGRTESRAISKIIDYVANPQKTDHGRLITGYECDSRVADAEFMLAKRQYIAATGRVRGADDVIAYHVRQSFCPGEITPEELQAEYAQLLEEKKKTYAEYRRSREEMRELLAAKANVDRLMSMEEEKQEDKDHEHGR